MAIDNSESVKYLEQDKKAKNFVALLKNDDGLNERFDLEFFTFGKNINTLDSLAFNEKQTNPTLLFEQFSEVYANTLAPMVLITDGNQTYGNDYEYVAQKYKQVIFPLILGDTTSYTDLRIEQLNVNKYAYLKNKFPIEVKIGRASCRERV